jgi:hypothetical protein
MTNPNPPALSPLTTLRIIWAALIAGPVMFGAIVIFMLGPQQRAAGASLQPLLLYANVAMVATLIPAAYIVRAVVYRAGRTEDGSVRPASYATGNILFLAMCEGAAFASLVFGLLNGGTGLPMLLAVIALVVELINFPTGRPLQPDEGVIRPTFQRPSADAINPRAK